MSKLTSDGYKASRGLSATAELFAYKYYVSLAVRVFSETKALTFVLMLWQFLGYLLFSFVLFRNHS